MFPPVPGLSRCCHGTPFASGVEAKHSRPRSCGVLFQQPRPKPWFADRLQMRILLKNQMRWMPQTVDVGQEATKLAEDVEWGSR